jgi:hypothetical protein
MLVVCTAYSTSGSLLQRIIIMSRKEDRMIVDQPRIPQVIYSHPLAWTRTRRPTLAPSASTRPGNQIDENVTARAFRFATSQLSRAHQPPSQTPTDHPSQQ